MAYIIYLIIESIQLKESTAIINVKIFLIAKNPNAKQYIMFDETTYQQQNYLKPFEQCTFFLNFVKVISLLKI